MCKVDQMTPEYEMSFLTWEEPRTSGTQLFYNRQQACLTSVLKKNTTISSKAFHLYKYPKKDNLEERIIGERHGKMWELSPNLFQVTQHIASGLGLEPNWTQISLMTSIGLYSHGHLTQICSSSGTISLPAAAGLIHMAHPSIRIYAPKLSFGVKSQS